MLFAQAKILDCINRRKLTSISMYCCFPTEDKCDQTLPNPQDSKSNQTFPPLIAFVSYSNNVIRHPEMTYEDSAQNSDYRSLGERTVRLLTGQEAMYTMAVVLIYYYGYHYYNCIIYKWLKC